jgi:hypothetical protein
MEADHRSITIHRIHLGLKPRCRNTLRRNDHATLSKALAMSSFRRREGIFRLMDQHEIVLNATAPCFSQTV